MIKNYINKKFFLIILFSYSIFFSYTSIFNLEIRFLYIISLILIFLDKERMNKFFLSKKILSTILISFFIYFYSSYFYFFEFSNLHINSLLLDRILNNFNIILFKELANALVVKKIDKKIMTLI